MVYTKLHAPLMYGNKQRVYQRCNDRGACKRNASRCRMCATHTCAPTVRTTALYSVLPVRPGLKTARKTPFSGSKRQICIVPETPPQSANRPAARSARAAPRLRYRLCLQAARAPAATHASPAIRSSSRPPRVTGMIENTEPMLPCTGPADCKGSEIPRTGSAAVSVAGRLHRVRPGTCGTHQCSEVARATRADGNALDYRSGASGHHAAGRNTVARTDVEVRPAGSDHQIEGERAARYGRVPLRGTDACRRAWRLKPPPCVLLSPDESDLCTAVTTSTSAWAVSSTIKCRRGGAKVEMAVVLAAASHR